MSDLDLYCNGCHAVTRWWDYGTGHIECSGCGCKQTTPEEPVDPDYVTKLEDALCMAICIIRNEAGTAGNGTTLNRWADELIAESGIDFDAVLDRTKEPEETNQPTVAREG